MKSIKMFGLAALAALMAMAFVGTTSAVAESTQLCDADPGNGSIANCLSGHAITSVHEESVGKVKLLGSPRIECNVLFSSTSVGALASPQVINGHFTPANCGCTVEEEAGTTAVYKFLKERHETAKVTLEVIFDVSCFGLECTFNTEVVGTAKGPLLSAQNPDNGEIVFFEQLLQGEGAFCSSSSRLDMTMSPLVATYIAN